MIVRRIIGLVESGRPHLLEKVSKRLFDHRIGSLISIRATGWLTMQKLIRGISDGSICHLSLIDEISEYSEEVTVSTYPDPNLVTHDKFTDKEYFLEDEMDFSEYYSVIFKADIDDYGFNVDGELLVDLGDERKLSYVLHRINERQRKIELRGILKGGYSDIDEEAIAKLRIKAVTKESYLTLDLFKELAIDAYLLEAESNIKMAFFTYFSAMEAVIRYRLDEIKKGVYTELHDALEHLSLDAKVRIVAKNSFSTYDLASVAIWGEYQGALRNAKRIRNLIAHGKLDTEISNLDLQRCIACYVITYCFSFKGCTTFNDIRAVFK